MQFIKARRVDQNEDINENTDPEGRLQDLEKAYPRVPKPALWEFLKRQGPHGKFFHCITDLHESTNYCVKSQHSVSSSWNPERGLREGCPTFPVLFNLFHQMVIEIAETKRRQLGNQSRKKVGIEWSWLPGKLPSNNQYGRYNSEAKQTNITMSLFVDDTTILGTKDELEQGCKIIKDVMTSFEEKDNEAKEEKLALGEISSHGNRMLGSWINPKVGAQNRIKRAGHLWGKVRPQLVKSKMSKNQKAVVIQRCVESGLLFDAAVRPWQKRELKNFQQWLDKRYKYTWSYHKEAPLKTMQRTSQNMQKIRNLLGMKSVQWKVVKRSLQRIGRVMRLNDERPTKRTVQGWISLLETVDRQRRKCRNTPQYWRRLLTEA